MPAPRRQTPMATTDVAAVVSSVATQSGYPVCGWLLVAAQWLGAAVHREVEWFRELTRVASLPGRCDLSARAARCGCQAGSPRGQELWPVGLRDVWSAQ